MDVKDLREGRKSLRSKTQGRNWPQAVRKYGFTLFPACPCPMAGTLVPQAARNYLTTLCLGPRNLTSLGTEGMTAQRCFFFF